MRRPAETSSRGLLSRPVQKLRNELLGAALDAWEAEDGAFTDGELKDAARRLGVERSKPTSAV